MNPNNDIKLPSWVTKVIGTIIVISIAVLLFNNFQSQLRDLGKEKITVPLRPNEWSQEVATPEGTSYRIASDVDTEVCFQDGFCSYVGPSYKDTKYGIRRGIFSFQSCDEGTVTITITS